MSSKDTSANQEPDAVRFHYLAEERHKLHDVKRKHDHIVVIMLENRTFDNLLGYLYEDDPDKVNGVAGKNLSNPIPEDAPERGGRTHISVCKGNEWNSPALTPGEEHPFTNTQMYNVFNPPENKDITNALECIAPYNVPGKRKKDTLQKGDGRNEVKKSNGNEQNLKKNTEIEKKKGRCRY